MLHRIFRIDPLRRRRAALAVAAAALLLAACAGPSGGGGSTSAPSGPPPEDPWGRSATRTETAGTQVMAGWMDLRSGRAGVSKLALVCRESREGELLLSGRAVMPEAKLIEAEQARLLVEAFDKQGFHEWAVSADPEKGPSGAVGVVWLRTEGGLKSLFLMRGAVNDPRTRDLPKAYEGLKALILSIHVATPGFQVKTGRGWSGDDVFRRGGR